MEGRVNTRPRPSEPPPWPQLEASPALLLPVRIETRFADDTSQPELWVRIFPDQIAVDSFEPEVTEAEEEATHAYWERLWRAGEGDEKAELAAWRALASAYGAERAAYLAQLAALQPTNPGQRPAAATPKGTPLDPAPDFAPLPAQLRRPASWSRAPRGAGLPDHFVVVLSRDGEEVGRAVGAPVASPLAVGPDPAAPTPEPGPGEPPVDDGMRWAVDFDAAVEAGMGLRIAISGEDRRAGFDRIVVIGMRTPAAGRTAAEEVGELLTVHRFGDGLALVPQGSPTNNTREAPSAYTRADPDYRGSFAAERGKPLEQHDGAALAAALGQPPEFFAHTEHSDGRGGEDALQMLVAVWPATLGYWLRQMMGEVCTESEARAIRDYARAWLRPRGSVPAFRVGETPYGVLPTTALSRWSHRETSRKRPVSAGLATMLRRLWPAWRESAADAPHMEREGDPDAALVETLGMDASARAYNVRPAVGQELLGDFYNFFSFAGFDDPTQPIGPGAEELHRLGYADWDPRLVHMALAEHPAGVKAPIVQEGPLSETKTLAEVKLPDGTAGNYISWLRHSTIAAIKDDDHAFPGGAPKTLLYEVLRQAVLRQYAETAWEVLIDHELIDVAAAREQELVGFEHLAGAELKPLAEGAVAKRMTAWQALSQPMPESPAKETIAEAIQRISPIAIAEFPHLGELGAALDRLAELPTAELERLFTETLDSFSHRLDPWLAALVDERRAGAQGLQLGAFGWVEDVRPGPPPRLVEEPGEEEEEEADALPLREPHSDNGGFVHAPSSAQAATGAVLRSGWMTHRETAEGKLLAVDLSSARVRVALELLEGVRQGQSLAALLGYRFERNLHQNRLDVYVQSLRDRYPVVANKVTEPPGPAEAVAASNVVDGLALHDAWEGGTVDWGGIGAGGEDREAVEAALRELDDALDSLGDVSIAESVFQAVRGNYGRAGGMIDAISRGERPPEPEVVHTPRGGLDYTNRLALIATGGLTRSAQWPGAGEPRSLAEPRLDAWASHFLPRPDRVKARVEYQTEGGSSEVVVSLADLELGPLDALAIASSADEPQQSELEQLIVYHGGASLPPATVVKAVSLVFARDPAWSGEELSFPEFLAAARATRDALTGARALRPDDLAPHEKQTGLEANVDGTELRERAVAAVKSLQTRADALKAAVGAAAIRTALLDAGRAGVPGAVPAHARGEDAATVAALEKQAEEIAKLLQERHDKAKAEDEAFDRAKAEPQALHEHDADLIRGALGRDLPVCPLFQVPEAATVEAALAASAELLDGDKTAPARWLQQLTHVRPGVSRWDLALSVAELLEAAPRKQPHLAQLPVEPNDRWLALPLDPTKPLPTPGRVALAAWLAGGSDLSQPTAGLLLDEWPEQIPSAAESTGVAFHYDQPDSRAPQSLLLAICPDESKTWEEDTLLAVVEETLELAKARAVDLETLRGIGQLVPALMLPFNVDGETVSWNAGRLT